MQIPERAVAMNGVDEDVRNVARALILRAIRDYVCYKKSKCKKRKKIYTDVAEWMYGVPEDAPIDDLPDLPPDMSPEEARRFLRVSEQIMSFEGICELLGWSPSYIRAEVKRLTPRDLARLGRNGVKMDVFR